MKEEIDEIRREIYWIFRAAIHSGKNHIQVGQENGKLFSYRKVENSTCFCCDALGNAEEKIAKLFGDDYYTKTLSDKELAVERLCPHPDGLKVKNLLNKLSKKDVEEINKIQKRLEIHEKKAN